MLSIQINSVDGGNMYSDKEIRSVFKSMGLLSEKERNVFKTIEQLEQETTESQYWIRASNNSFEMEEEDAKLEGDSR